MTAYHDRLKAGFYRADKANKKRKSSSSSVDEPAPRSTSSTTVYHRTTIAPKAEPAGE